MAKMFSMFDPTREGKGVKKQTVQKKRFFVFWELVARKLTKLCLLNIIYLLCCLPIITIGPATAGLMYVLRNMALQKPVFVAHDFFDAFKKNFKSSLFAGIIVILTLAISIFAGIFYFDLATGIPADGSSSFLGMSPSTVVTFGTICAILACVVGFFMLFMSYYVYLLIVTVDLPLKKIFKNSALLAIAGFKTNIITTIFVIAIVGLCLVGLLLVPINFVVGILLAVFLVAFIHFIIAFNSYQYIKKYVTDPFYEAKGEKAPDDPVEGEHIFND